MVLNQINNLDYYAEIVKMVSKENILHIVNKNQNRKIFKGFFCICSTLNFVNRHYIISPTILKWNTNTYNTLMHRTHAETL